MKLNQALQSSRRFASTLAGHVKITKADLPASTFFCSSHAGKYVSKSGGHTRTLHEVFDTRLLRASPALDPQPNVFFEQSLSSNQRRLGQPDEREVTIGKTIRTLRQHLPHILETPLPAKILSPSVKLHLFPSTHPNIPRVSGRVPYLAALRLASWTVPVILKRQPPTNHVRLEILSERMIKVNGRERLMVRWQTALDHPHSDEGCMAGWFWFEFDEFGKLSSHVVEDVEYPTERQQKPSVATSIWEMFGSGSRKEEQLAWYYAPLRRKRREAAGLMNDRL
ncbi:hypothetical protein YB2330_002112 [Saitoella coloradoensis]